VRYRTEVRGVGKPTHVYELTPEGQYLLSNAYVPALVNLLRAANTQLGEGVSDLVRDAGRALADANHPPADRRSRRASAEAYAALLRSLGGSAEVDEAGPHLLVRSECCPLGAVVGQAPIACKLFEGMARAITGRLVEEHCDRAEQPHCLFHIPKT
jgi:predicted ArsR family transcriptional regulator